MPINVHALSSPEPDPTPPPTQGEAQSVSEHVSSPESAPEAKPKRRNKTQMIADAVVPADGDLVDVKDAGTGAKVQRPWLEAVQLVADGKAEWVKKDMKYAVLKMEQQRAASAFDQPAPEQNVFAQAAAAVVPSENPADREVRYTANGQALLMISSADGSVAWTADGGESGTMTIDEWSLLSMTPAPTGATSSNVPPEAQIGDEVRVGAETLRVGHGRVLTNSPVAIDGELVQPARRWQRTLGAGPAAPWESTLLTQTKIQSEQIEQAKIVPNTAVGPVFNEKGEFDGLKPANETPEEAFNAGHAAGAHDAKRNGDAPTVQTERLPRTYDELGDGVIKIGTGILEKIGMPDYSSFQIGPITISRTVVDDGRRQTVTFADGRQGEVISAAVEGYDLLDNTVEFVAGRFRGQLLSFLQANGAIKQPVA